MRIAFADMGHLNQVCAVCHRTVECTQFHASESIFVSICYECERKRVTVEDVEKLLDRAQPRMPLVGS